jgi:ParB family chromosome partitioning protein
VEERPPSRRRSRWEVDRARSPRRLHIKSLAANPLNPRDYPEEEIDELAETFKLVGQLQPILVVPRTLYLEAHPDQKESLGTAEWVVVAGNRRLAAAKKAGLEWVEILVSPNLDSSNKIDEAIVIENTQRTPIPPLREAEILRDIQIRESLSLRELATRIGKSHAYVQQRLDLLHLIPEFKELYTSKVIAFNVARRIAIQPEGKQREILASGPPYRSRSGPEAPPAGRAAVHPVSTGDGDALVGALREALRQLELADEPTSANGHVRAARRQIEAALAALQVPPVSDG